MKHRQSDTDKLLRRSVESKNQRKHSKSNSNLQPEAKPGFFDETSLSHRKTMHILCIALRVYDLGPTIR